MSTHATATCEHKHWDERPCAEFGTESKMTRVDTGNVFKGDIEGESLAQFLIFYATAGTGSYVGYERITGSLGGRAGSFVLNHEGTFEGAVVTTRWSVAPGSGTGALAGLTGRGGFRSVHGEGDTPLTLEYDVA